MADCCSEKACALDVLKEKQSGTLRIVLAINAVMFVVEFSSGLMAGSTALLSDSLDNLGDATTYGLSLYAISRGARAKAKVALFKAGLIFIAALFVIGQVAYGLTHPGTPLFEVMGAISVLALAANSTCLVLLWKHRDEDVNMSSVWECSRNDIASNIAVFVAAGLVWATESGWPDIAVGSALAVLLLSSSAKVCATAMRELRSAGREAAL